MFIPGQVTKLSCSVCLAKISPKYTRNGYLSFKAIKTLKGALAIQRAPIYLEIRIYVFDEDRNVFVPPCPKNRNGAVEFGAKTEVPSPEDLKSLIISEDKRAPEVVTEHFKKVNAFENCKVPVPERTDIISRLKRELPAI